jgi:hypothetical protein
MKIEYGHKLSNEEAYTRLNGFLEQIKVENKEKIDSVSTTWNEEHTKMDFSVKAMGISTTGQLYLTDGQIMLDGKVPLLAKPFAGKIEEIIRQKLEELLS